VLLDSEAAFFSLTREYFARWGLVLESTLWARGFFGEGLRTFQVAMRLGLDETSAHELAAARDAGWRERLRSPVPRTPGMEALLEKLQERGHRMAVVTGAPRDHFEGLHRHTSMLRFFEFSITCDECPQVKPLPDAYLLATHRMGVCPSDCIAIEDSPRGVRAALAAGMRCILFATPLTDTSLCIGVDRVVHNVLELENALQDIAPA